MNKKRPIALLLCLAVMVTVFAGCGGSGNTPASSAPASEPAANPSTAPESAASEGAAPAGDQPYAGTTIRVMFANHNWTEAVKPHLEEFTAQTGIELNTESYPEDQLSQKLSIELTAGASGLDIFMSRPLQELKLFVKNGWIKDFTDVLADPNVDADDFIPSTLDAYKEGDVYYGVPLVTERQILYYRKDLFEAANLEVPTTMEELRACAEALTDKDNEVYGFVSRGLTAAAVTQFSGYLYGLGGDWMTDGKASINSPQAVEALTFYGDMLRNYGPPGVLNMHWQQAAAVFAQGSAAMYTDADSLYNSAVDPTQSTIADQVGYAVLPTGAAYNITSWGLCIGANSQNPEAAGEFAKWASGKEIMTIAQTFGLPGSRQSVWDNPDANKGFPAELVEVIRASSAIGVAYDRPQVIQVGKARDSIGAAIVAAIEGGDVQAAADKANAEFQAIIDEDFGS